MKPRLFWRRSFQKSRDFLVRLYAAQSRQCNAPTLSDTILEQLSAIEALHDKFSLPNPVRTAAVRSAMETVVKAAPPRSWPKKDKAAFAMLPSDIQLILAKRQEQMDTEIRRLQSKVAQEMEILRSSNNTETKIVHSNEKEATHETQI